MARTAVKYCVIDWNASSFCQRV